jgi:cyclic pyranopterin phosphate synthase
MALDRFGRTIDYLRISLTDRCNLRCLYCMPDDIDFRPPAELMSDEEIVTFAKNFSQLGFNKIRLTGGEPTVRAGIVDLVSKISKLPGIETVTMTSNGVLFSQFAEALAQAGLKRVNFSLDTMDVGKYEKITHKDVFQSVIQGINTAEAVGLVPVKINVVVIRGYNDDEIVDLASLTYQHKWQVRFIEVMPLGKISDFQISQMVTASEMREILERSIGKLEKIGAKLDGETSVYRLPGAIGEIGFISSVSEPFCASCNRIRLTADGKMRLCLLRDIEIDLLSDFREGCSEAELRAKIIDAIWNKPWGNGLAEGLIPLNRTMSEIGG